MNNCLDPSTFDHITTIIEDMCHLHSRCRTMLHVHLGQQTLRTPYHLAEYTLVAYTLYTLTLSDDLSTDAILELGGSAMRIIARLLPWAQKLEAINILLGAKSVHKRQRQRSGTSTTGWFRTVLSGLVGVLSTASGVYDLAPADLQQSTFQVYTDSYRTFAEAYLPSGTGRTRDIFLESTHSYLTGATTGQLPIDDSPRNVYEFSLAVNETNGALDAWYETGDELPRPPTRYVLLAHSRSGTWRRLGAPRSGRSRQHTRPGVDGLRADPGRETYPRTIDRLLYVSLPRRDPSRVWTAASPRDM